MESITELVLELARPETDLFDAHRRRELITRRGREAVRALLPLLETDPALVVGLLRDTLRGLSDPVERGQARDDLEHHVAPTNPVNARKLCIGLLVEIYPDAAHLGRRFLDFANNHEKEPKDVRLSALDAVARLQPTSALVAPLVDLLRDQDADVVHKTLGSCDGTRGSPPRATRWSVTSNASRAPRRALTPA
jgi:hypothetical protein